MKVSELTGELLDYWVARAERYQTIFINSTGCCIEKYSRKHNPAIPFSPSTDWSQGGPLLERENIRVERIDRRPIKWGAFKPDERSGFLEDATYKTGSTYLEAGMRCYVASKFGDEVDDSQTDPL